jgi:DNA-binding winged helix-turn-helix (wHTH) protein/TolB-like protein
MKPSETWEFGCFTLDPSTRTLRYRGRDLAVPARSFDVLVTLVERQGTVVSKETLLAATWGEVAVEENTLVQAISALRRALREACGDDTAIATIPGKGYQFTAPVRVGARWRRPQRATAAIVLLVAAMSSVTAWRFHWLHVWEDRCVAVLPFEAAGGPALAGAAIADGLIVRLASPRHVRVRPTSDVPPGLMRDYRRLGAALKVDRLVSGTIRTTAAGIRITVEVIDVNKEAAIWGAAFEDSGGTPSQSLIARIADAVRPQLSY